MSWITKYSNFGVILKQVGDYLRSPCPFHKEQEASFFVYPDGGYHCFGCGAHGTYDQFLEHMGVDSQYRVEKLSDWTTPPNFMIDTWLINKEKHLQEILKDQPFTTKIKVFDQWDQCVILARNIPYEQKYPLRFLASLEHNYCRILKDNNLEIEDPWNI